MPTNLTFMLWCKLAKPRAMMLLLQVGISTRAVSLLDYSPPLHPCLTSVRSWTDFSHKLMQQHIRKVTQLLHYLLHHQQHTGITTWIQQPWWVLGWTIFQVYIIQLQLQPRLIHLKQLIQVRNIFYIRIIIRVFLDKWHFNLFWNYFGIIASVSGTLPPPPPLNSHLPHISSSHSAQQQSGNGNNGINNLGSAGGMSSNSAINNFSSATSSHKTLTSLSSSTPPHSSSHQSAAHSGIAAAAAAAAAVANVGGFNTNVGSNNESGSPSLTGGNGTSANIGGGGTTSPSCVSSLVSSSHFPTSLSPTGKFSDFSSGTFSPRDFHGSLGRDFSSALGVGMAAVAGAARHHQHHHHHHPTALDRYPYLSQVNQT